VSTLRSSDLLAAIGVEYAVAEIDIGAPGALDQQELVRPHPEMTIGEAPPLLGREADRLRNAVDDDEVVAGALHLREPQFHRGIIADRRTLRRLRAGAMTGRGGLSGRRAFAPAHRPPLARRPSGRLVATLVPIEVGLAGRASLEALVAEEVLLGHLEHPLL